MTSGSPNWLEIKKVRADMSEYVMHCTRARWYPTEVEAYEVLKEILSDGFLRATCVTENRDRPGIRGPHPAVCFTEQPLGFFVRSVAASWVRYTEFAIAFRKDDLFYYGGSPVIYGSGSYLEGPVSKGADNGPPWVYANGLPREMQYLWVAYDPTALWKNEYPLDWTHEREWRARPNVNLNTKLGMSGREADAIPLAITTARERVATDAGFIILVDSEDRKLDLGGWIAANVGGIGGRGNYWTGYAVALRQVRILSFEKIKADLSASGMLGRLDDYYPTWEA